MPLRPYRIAEDIDGVGFKTVDGIAREVGIKENDSERIMSGIQYTLTLALEEGHTYLPKDLLIDKTKEILGVSEDLIEENIGNLTISNRIPVRCRFGATRNLP